MIESHGDEAADEAKVLYVVGIDVGGRVDLEAVVVLGRVLEEAVHGIEDLVRDEEEPLARHAAVVEALLALEREKELAAQVVRGQLGDLAVRVVEERLTRHLHLHVARKRVRLTQVAELAHLPAKVALVGELAARILERRQLVVVVDEVALALVRVADLPALGQHGHLATLRARILPLGRVVLVVHKVRTVVDVKALLLLHKQKHVTKVEHSTTTTVVPGIEDHGPICERPDFRIF